MNVLLKCGNCEKVWTPDQLPQRIYVCFVCGVYRCTYCFKFESDAANIKVCNRCVQECIVDFKKIYWKGERIWVTMELNRRAPVELDLPFYDMMLCWNKEFIRIFNSLSKLREAEETHPTKESKA